MPLDIAGAVTLGSLGTAASLDIQAIDADAILSSLGTAATLSVQGIRGAVTLAPIFFDGEIETKGAGDGQFRPQDKEAFLAFEEGLVFGTSSTNVAAADREFGKVVTLSTQAGLFFDMGARLVVASRTNPKSNYFCGPSFNYVGTSLQMAVTKSFGADTIADWIVYQGAPPATADPLAAPMLMHALCNGL